MTSYCSTQHRARPSRAYDLQGHVLSSGLFTETRRKGSFSKVPRSKRPTELSRKRPRAAWWHRFGVETHLPSGVRCAVVYQGVATRNAPTTREILHPRIEAQPNLALSGFSEHRRVPRSFTRAGAPGA
jgi:hypothetical protein